jgi:Gpi18-like mannosyltransferase
LLKLLTFIPVSSLYSIKTLSVLFDIAIAALASVLVQRTAARRYSKSEGFFIFALFFSIPTFILNSALWAQSDAVYAAGVLLSLYFILTNKALPAVIAFSVALSCKVQAIFFLPVLVGYCLRTEKTAGYLVLIPILFFLSIIPARLAGGSLADLLLVYVKQSGEYSSLSVSAQSVFALLGEYQFTPFAQTYLFWVGLGWLECVRQ